VAVLLPGKFIYLAHPHTASSAMVLGLQDAFEDAFDLRPHHMTLADVRREPGAVDFEQISRQRTRVWHHRKELPYHFTRRGVLPEEVPGLITGEETVFSVVRNPYDYLATCFLRHTRGAQMGVFLRSFRKDPYLRQGQLWYHRADSDVVLQYERLEDELAALMERLGLGPVKLGQHNQTTEKQPWETYYTPEYFGIVNERFGDEIAEFYEPRTS
jgi:hypothetical protein